MMYKHTLEDSSRRGTETSNTIVLDVGKAQICTKSGALGRSNPSDNELKLVVVVVHY